jgi:hypothetical protein
MRAPLLAVLPVVLLAALAPAEDAGEDVVVGRFEGGGRPIPSLSDESAKAYGFPGWIDLGVGGFLQIKARRAVVWIDPAASRLLIRLLGGERKGLPVWALHAVYAEGGALPATFRTAGRTYRCSSMYYDFRTHRGVLVDAEVRIPLGRKLGRETSLYLRAERFRSMKPGVFEAEKVGVSTDRYADPEVEIRARRVKLSHAGVTQALQNLIEVTRRRGEAGGPTDADFEAALGEVRQQASDLDQQNVKLEGLTARLFGLPVLYWPRFTLEGIEPPDLEWSVDVRSRGQLGSGISIGVGKSYRADWGKARWRVGPHWFFRRGAGGFGEADVSAWEGRLRGRSYATYLHDDDDDDGIPPSTKNRYWHQHQYRYGLTDFWRLDGEWSDISDQGFLRLWDEREFKEGKEQETLLYLRGRGDTGYLTLTGKVRTIPFLNVLEELPRATAALPVLHLLDVGGAALQVAASFEAGNLRRRAPDGSGAPDFRIFRADGQATVSLGFSLGAVRVVPFASFRGTAYEETLVDGSAVGRFAGSGGVRADVMASRWYGRRRHIINLSVEYTNLYEVSVDASELFPLDRVDLVTPFEQLGVRLRNRLQRRTKAGIRTTFDLEVFAAWFPDGEQPEGRTGDGFLELDLEWVPRTGVDVSARTSFDTEDGTVDTGSVEVRWQARPTVRLGLGFRHLDNVSDVFTGTAQYDVGSRWRVVGLSQIDARGGDFLDQGLRLERYGRQVVVALRFLWDPGDNDFTFGVHVDLIERFKRRERVRSPRDAVGWN